jgi:hypothetical protein
MFGAPAAAAAEQPPSYADSRNDHSASPFVNVEVKIEPCC